MTTEAGGERHPEDGWPVVAFADQHAFAAWWAKNAGLALRLIEEGRMRPPGLTAIEAARASGRWPL